ncbi:hypothetical protein EXIGLDRAFT_844290 [Exidia glandulosa HHB12029]|uniref:Secreted protein n=1 Tax=Exidia glandulosa HHB12029 TaxID=1314781 RepID=A0A165C4W1_EXIGL|nr:hypothetical protein EXIGLDRAFT_844290 [Exidia glandulosa HHB12029]
MALASRRLAALFVAILARTSPHSSARRVHSSQALSVSVDSDLDLPLCDAWCTCCRFSGRQGFLSQTFSSVTATSSRWQARADDAVDQLANLVHMARAVV